MSSDANPQPYPGGPGQPPQYQQPPQGHPPQAYQQPPPGYQGQPYVEQGPPSGAGGQPPYLPPGAYVPAPMPPPGSGRGRGSKAAVAAILSVVLLAAVGAVVLFKFVLVKGPDPAESFPASASVYMELNLDPSFDQTPKLLEHLGKFDDLDYEDTNDAIADLLEESGLEGIDAEEDLTSWLGTRHGMAMWEHDDQPYAVISLASTDANDAENGLATIRAAAGAGEDQMAYAVKDDHVLIVAGETGAADALAAAESEAGSAPLAASQAYEDARNWLDGDQLVTYWVDLDAIAEVEELTGDDDAQSYLDFYSGQMIAGLSAFDEGFELNYRHFGARDDPWTGSEDLMGRMGELPAADLAVAAYLPENLTEIAEEWMGLLDDVTGTEDYESDEYATPEDYTDIVTAFTDLLAGASLSAAADFSNDDDISTDSLYAAVELAGDDAAELEALLNDLGGDVPDDFEVTDSAITHSGPGVASGALSEDSRFNSFAAAAPAEAAVAVWVDLEAAAEAHPAEFDGAEPLSAFAWAHGSADGDGTGVLRLYLRD